MTHFDELTELVFTHLKENPRPPKTSAQLAKVFKVSSLEMSAVLWDLVRAKKLEVIPGCGPRGGKGFAPVVKRGLDYGR